VGNHRPAIKAGEPRPPAQVVDWLPGNRKIRGKPIRPRWGFSLDYLEGCEAVRGDTGRKGPGLARGSGPARRRSDPFQVRRRERGEVELEVNI
jgi:hypothetical protein